MWHSLYVYARLYALYGYSIIDLITRLRVCSLALTIRVYSEWLTYQTWCPRVGPTLAWTLVNPSVSLLLPTVWLLQVARPSCTWEPQYIHHINNEHVILARILFHYEARAVRCGSSREVISSMVDIVWRVQFYVNITGGQTGQCLWQQRKVMKGGLLSPLNLNLI